MSTMFLNYVLPTRLAMRIARDTKMDEKIDMAVSNVVDAMKDFQRMAMIRADFTIACKSFESHFSTEDALTEDDIQWLRIIYDSATEEALGTVMESLMQVMSDAKENRTRVEAANAVRAILEGKTVSEEAVNKLIIKLAK